MVHRREFFVEFRAADDGDEGVLEGLATVYDVEYRIGWGLKESIVRGAFDASIAARGGVVPIFHQHDWSNPIGVGYLTSEEQGVNVRAELFVNDNPLARSVYLAGKAGALREWSIGFQPETITTRDDDPNVEYVERGILLECSTVVKGANPSTTMSARAEAEAETVQETDADAPALAEAVWDSLDNPAVRALIAAHF